MVIVVAQALSSSALMLVHLQPNNLNLSHTQKTCLFTNGNKANVSGIISALYSVRFSMTPCAQNLMKNLTTLNLLFLS